MHCLGCPSSRGETVEEACMVHGIDVDKLNEQRKSMLDELNQRKQQAEDEASSAQEAISKLK